MTTAYEDKKADEAPAEKWIYGWILVVAPILATGFAMIHPSLDTHELAGVLKELNAGATFNGWVHGSLIGLYMILVAGFCGFSRYLGLDRPLVVVALVAYVFGAFAMLGAAVVNGFALSLFAQRYAGAQPDQFIAIKASINAMGSISGTWAGIGAVASSAAIALWSVALLSPAVQSRAIGVFGLLLGIATSVMLVTGTLILNVHGFLLLVISQAAWTIAVGFQLLRAARLEHRALRGEV